MKLNDIFHLVASPGHQAVHHIKGVVTGAFQYKSGDITSMSVFLPSSSPNSPASPSAAPANLPSEVSSRQGGSQPLYFCSRTWRSPGSRPGGAGAGAGAGLDRNIEKLETNLEQGIGI